jgi:thymidine kinase
MNRGKIYFYHGPMASGKSLQILATAYNFQEKKIPFVIFKSEIDNRDGNEVIHSRALGDRECVGIKTTTNLYKLIVTMLNINNVTYKPLLKWVLIDEAQFLTREQVDQLGAVADKFGINVMCYGLRTDFKTNLFEGSKRLFEIADTIEEIKSSCECDNKCIFNARVDGDGNVVVDGEQIEIGGDDRYVSMCRKCYMEKIKHHLYIRNYE